MEEGGDRGGGSSSGASPAQLADLLHLQPAAPQAPTWHVPRHEAPPWATLPAVATVVLEVSRGTGGATATHKITDKKSFVIGRQADVADIVTDDPESSQQHAALVHSKGALYLIDLQSARGVFIGAQQLKPMHPMLLREGTTFRLGSTPWRYTIRGLDDRPPPRQNERCEERKVDTASPPAAPPQSGSPPPSQHSRGGLSRTPLQLEADLRLWKKWEDTLLRKGAAKATKRASPSPPAQLQPKLVDEKLFAGASAQGWSIVTTVGHNKYISPGGAQVFRRKDLALAWAGKTAGAAPAQRQALSPSRHAVAPPSAAPTPPPSRKRPREHEGALASEAGAGAREAGEEAGEEEDNVDLEEEEEEERHAPGASALLARGRTVSAVTAACPPRGRRL